MLNPDEVNEIEAPQLNSFERVDSEIELSPERQAVFDECVAGVDNEIIMKRVAEIGPEGVREILKKASGYVGGNIRTFSILGFAALSTYTAGGAGMTEEQYNHGFALIVADIGRQVPKELTGKTLSSLGYNDLQITKLMQDVQPDSALANAVASPLTGGSNDEE